MLWDEGVCNLIFYLEIKKNDLLYVDYSRKLKILGLFVKLFCLNTVELNNILLSVNKTQFVIRWRDINGLFEYNMAGT